MQPQIQRLAHDTVVYGGIGHHIHGRQFGHPAGHFLQLGEDLGPDTHKLLGFSRGQLGIVAADIAHRGQLDIAEGTLTQFPQAVEMPRAHAAATHQSKPDLVHYSSFCFRAPAGSAHPGG